MRFLLPILICLIGTTPSLWGSYDECTTIEQQKVIWESFQDVLKTFQSFPRNPLLASTSTQTRTYLQISRSITLPQILQYLPQAYPYSREVTHVVEKIVASNNETLMLETLLFILPRVETFSEDATFIGQDVTSSIDGKSTPQICVFSPLSPIVNTTEPVIVQNSTGFTNPLQPLIILDDTGTVIQNVTMIGSISPLRQLIITTESGAVIQSTPLIGAFALLLQIATQAPDSSDQLQKIACSLYAAMPHQFTVTGTPPHIQHTPQAITASSLLTWLASQPFAPILHFQNACMPTTSTDPKELAEKMDHLLHGYTKLRDLYPGSPCISHHQNAKFEHYFRRPHPRTLIYTLLAYSNCEDNMDRVLESVLNAKDLGLFLATLIHLLPPVINFAQQTWIHPETQALHLLIDNTAVIISRNSWLEKWCLLAMDVYNLHVNSLPFRKIATGMLTIMLQDIDPQTQTVPLLQVVYAEQTVRDLIVFLTQNSFITQTILTKTSTHLTNSHLSQATQFSDFDKSLKGPSTFSDHPLFPPTHDLTQKACTYITNDLLLACQYSHVHHDDFSQTSQKFLAHKDTLSLITTLHYLCPKACGTFQVQWHQGGAVIQGTNTPPLFSHANSRLTQVLALAEKSCWLQQDPHFPQMAAALCALMPEEVQHVLPIPPLEIQNRYLCHGELLAEVSRARRNITCIIQEHVLPLLVHPSHNVEDNELCYFNEHKVQKKDDVRPYEFENNNPLINHPQGRIVAFQDSDDVEAAHALFYYKKTQDFHKKSGPIIKKISDKPPKFLPKPKAIRGPSSHIVAISNTAT